MFYSENQMLPASRIFSFVARPIVIPSTDVKDLPDLAIRSGKWKLLCEYDGSDALLYDLTTDRGEQDNLAPKHPKIVKELSQKVIAWHKSMPPDNGPQMIGNSKKK